MTFEPFFEYHSRSIYFGIGIDLENLPKEFKIDIGPLSFGIQWMSKKDVEKKIQEELEK